MNRHNIDISIIVVNHNRSNYIERCLRSCIDQVLFNKNFEVIFIDDASKEIISAPKPSAYLNF